MEKERQLFDGLGRDLPPRRKTLLRKSLAETDCTSMGGLVLKADQRPGEHTTKCEP